MRARHVQHIMHTAKQAFIRDMMSSFRRSCRSTENLVNLDDLRSRVMDIAIVSVNKAHIELYGSHVSGFGVPEADVDMSLTYRRFSPWLQGLPRVDEQDGKRLTRFGREAARVGCSQVRLIRSRIPVVQFVDPVTQLHCDVTIGNNGGVANSHILRQMYDIYPDFYHAYVHTIKTWAKAREVISPDKGMFNSFAMTTLAMMVLQELGLLPVFGSPSGELGELTGQDVKAALDHFCLPAVYADLYGDDVRLGEAVLFCLQRFAEYVTQFDFAQGTVSLVCPRRRREGYASAVRDYMNRYGARVRAEWNAHIAENPHDGPFDERVFKECMHNHAVQRPSDGPFVVEDFVNYVNCGRRVMAGARTRHAMAEFERLREGVRDESRLCYGTLCQPSNVMEPIFTSDRSTSRVVSFSQDG